MSQVVCCDRCKSYNVQVVPVVGIDLCNACLKAFRVWAQGAEVERSKESDQRRKRSVVGGPRKVVAQILAEHGEVTPQTYGSVTQQGYRSAYFSLSHLSRNGVLEKVKRPGNVVVFVAARAEAAE